MKKERGFTIIEVITAISIIAVLAVTVVPLISKSISSNRYASNRTKAVNAALTKIEALRQTEFLSLSSGTFSAPEVQGSGTVTVSDKDWDEDGTIDAKEEELKNVVVRIDWNESGQTKHITMATYIAKNGINRK